MNNDLPKSILKYSQTNTTKIELSELEGLKLLKSVLKKESEISQASESVEAFPRSIMKNDHLKSKEEQNGGSRCRSSEREDNFAKQSCSDDDSEAESNEKGESNTVPFTRSRITKKKSRFSKNQDSVDTSSSVQSITVSAMSRNSTKQQSVSERRKNVVDDVSAIIQAK